MLGVGYLLSMNQRDESTIVEVDGKSLRLTHLSKVMFPEDGFTKAELLLYYQTVAPLLLPHLRGRPLTLKAFPHGVKERPYYRRRLAATAPPWLSRFELEDGAAPCRGRCCRPALGRKPGFRLDSPLALPEGEPRPP